MNNRRDISRSASIDIASRYDAENNIRAFIGTLKVLGQKAV